MCWEPCEVLNKPCFSSKQPPHKHIVTPHFTYEIWCPEYLGKSYLIALYEGERAWTSSSYCWVQNDQNLACKTTITLRFTHAFLMGNLGRARLDGSHALVVRYQAVVIWKYRWSKHPNDSLHGYQPPWGAGCQSSAETTDQSTVQLLSSLCD